MKYNIRIPKEASSASEKLGKNQILATNNNINQRIASSTLIRIKDFKNFISLLYQKTAEKAIV